MPSADPGPVLEELAHHVAQHTETPAMHIANHDALDAAPRTDIDHAELYLRGEHEAGRAIEIAQAA